MAYQRSAEKEEFWRLALAEQDNSGLTVSEFCRQQSLSQPSFYAWRRKLRQRDQLVAGDTPLVPVTVVSAQAESLADKPSVKIRLPGGIVIDVFTGQAS